MIKSTRRSFLKASTAAGAALLPGVQAFSTTFTWPAHPLAIAMWDFSWLERRWPGAGYEDWDRVLDELKQRGYDAVRIDPYPHLLAVDPAKEWELLPCWNQEMWGSPARNRVRVQPNLMEFLGCCKRHDILVAFSTWWREDVEKVREKILTPASMADVWTKTIDAVAEAGFLDRILYVDMSNEFCIPIWTPWLPVMKRSQQNGAAWMRETIGRFRQKYPGIRCTFSFTDEYESWRDQDVAALDLLELHIWMTTFSDFYQKIDYHFEEFDQRGYDKIQLNAERLYRSNPALWKKCLCEGIDRMAEWGRVRGKPLITTECWAVVNYKDWPLLNWGWVKELCEIGVGRAAATGQWAAMATSNFCGPQFVGMWKDVEWHRKLTEVIHQSRVPPRSG